MAQGNTISQRIAIEGAENVISLLQRMGTEGEAAIKRLQNAASTGGQASGIAKNIDEASTSVDHFQVALSHLEGVVGPAISRLNRFTQSFGELRGAIGAIAPLMKEFAEVGIGVGFLLAARSAATATREIVNQSRELGFTIQQFEGLQLAAAKSGVSFDVLTRLLDRFTARLGEAQRVQEEFTQTQGVQEEEFRIHSDRLQQSMRKQDEELSKARRTLDDQSLAYKRLNVDMARYNESVDKQTVATTKLAQANARNVVPQTALTRLEQKTSLEQGAIRTAEAQIAAEERLRSIENTRVDTMARMRDIQDQQKTSLAEFNLVQEKSRIAAEKNKDEFSKLGIVLKDNNGEWKQGYAVLLEYSDKLNSMSNASERANSLLHVFGRGWAQMEPLLKLGSKQIQEITIEFEKMGVGMTKAEQGMAENFNAAWGKMTIVLDSMKNALGNILGQTLVPIFDAISQFLVNQQANLRAFANAFANLVVPALQVSLRILNVFFSAAASLAGLLTSRFDALAQAINKVAGTNLTGADLLVGLGVFYLTITRLLPLVQTLFFSITRLGPALSAFAKGIYEAIAGMRLFNSAGALFMLTPLGLIEAAFIAVAAAMLIWPDKFGPVFQFMKEGLDNLIGTAKALWELLLAIAQAMGAISGDTAKGLSTDGPPSGGSSSDDFGKRVEQENPKLYRAGGGWIPGSGRGDRVPVMAEPGEFVVRRSVASQWSGFLSALNAGMVRGFSLGGIVDSMNSMAGAPAAAAIPAKPANDQALFHLTIGDKTFHGLSAPKDTANQMLDYARTSSVVSAGKKPSWHGSG